MEDLMKKAQEEHDIASQQYMELDEHDSQRKAQKDRIDELTMTMNVIAEFMAGDSYGVPAQHRRRRQHYCCSRWWQGLI
ncbi:hypothetical protein N7468_005771 [Penicillium chermesinum]|uniref:Uncharacterized protein n=1 Tax=Penicillium chermesinum TaxID=63820 RepID=A0A9W9P0G4_9EURO|nr:uncharacterized protein N7468_005771 [Penicillium chermesinum]KAJ5232815.1 hypothetical protein N7468_005771 [Penicillium chermesinum]